MQKIIVSILIILLCINVLYVFSGVVFYPLQSIDAIGIWLLKAKAFYIEGGFPNVFLHDPNYLYSHPQYPLLVPFGIYLFYLFVGNIADHTILYIYPIAYCIIIYLMYKILRRKTSVIMALLFTYIFSMFSPLIAAGGRILAGNADIFLVLIECLIVYILTKKSLKMKDFILVTVLIIIASQIKLEGAFLSAFLLFIPVEKRIKFGLLSISLLPTMLWFFSARLLHIPSDLQIILPTIPVLLERLYIIAVGTLRELRNVNNWYIFWPLMLLLLFIKRKTSTQMRNIFLPTLAVMLPLYYAVYLFSNIDTYNYINSSLDRVFLQQLPIFFLFFFERIVLYIQPSSKSMIERLLLKINSDP